MRSAAAVARLGNSPRARLVLTSANVPGYLSSSRGACAAPVQQPPERHAYQRTQDRG